MDFLGGVERQPEEEEADIKEEVKMGESKDEAVKQEAAWSTYSPDDLECWKSWDKRAGLGKILLKCI